MTTSERRINACLAACERLSTEALESGIIADAFHAVGLLSTAVALIKELADQDADPSAYIRLAGVLDMVRQLNQDIAAEGADTIQGTRFPKE